MSVVDLISSAPSSKIRNLCIVAHVDHGKTTLTDHLLVADGHLSSKLIAEGSKSGKAIRFLDSRHDEIVRQITIKSSCVSLSTPFGLLNLIDSPGHMDFNAEVSAAARLTDGAVLVVDAVEGVRAQTRTVMRQVWKDKLTPLLFVNKLDRLVQLCPDPSEAYSRIRAIIENVNILFSQMMVGDKEERGMEDVEHRYLHAYTFDPEKGNVLFGSALQGWCFDLRTWAEKLIVPKMPTCDSLTLSRHLWGEWVMSSASPFEPVKRVSQSKPNLAVRMLFEPLWKLLEKNSDVGNAKLVELFPFAKDFVSKVFEVLPNPDEAVSFRSPEIIHEIPADATVLFVAKHAPADLARCCLIGDTFDSTTSAPDFVGMARVFSGSVSAGQELFICTKTTVHESVTIRQLYGLIGASIVPISHAVSGAVVAFTTSPELPALLSGGATLSTTAHYSPLESPYLAAQAIVRVSVEPKRMADEDVLDAGLEMLRKSDPAVVVERVKETGERVIACCGDEHLARCVQDLCQIFTKVEISVSKPIVELRETLEISEPCVQPLPNFLAEFETSVDRATSTGVSSSGDVVIRIKASPLSLEILSLLDCGDFSAACMEKVLAWSVKNFACNILIGEEATPAMIRGFHLACSTGPVCGEPVRGVLWEVVQAEGQDLNNWNATYAASRAMRAAMLAFGPRLCEPLLMVDLQTEMVRPVIAVLGQRRGEVIDSDLIEGSNAEHAIKAEVPAIEAFTDRGGATFADDLRSAARGKILWRLGFSRWRILEGESPLDEASMARKIATDTRKRKGLPVGEKNVAVAEKQRTLSRTK